MLRIFYRLGGENTAIKLPKKSGKKRQKKAKEPAHNEQKLTESEHNRIIDFNAARKAAERKYKGTNPAKIRDEKASKTLTIGDLNFALEVSAVPDVKVYATEGGVPRSGAKKAVKQAAKTGVYKRQNH